MSSSARCFSSLFIFLALAKEMIRPLIYAFAQSHKIRGDISGEVLVSKYFFFISVFINVMNSPSLRSDAFNRHCLVDGLLPMFHDNTRGA